MPSPRFNHCAAAESALVSVNLWRVSSGERQGKRARSTDLDEQRRLDELQSRRKQQRTPTFSAVSRPRANSCPAAAALSLKINIAATRCVDNSTWSLRPCALPARRPPTPAAPRCGSRRRRSASTAALLSSSHIEADSTAPSSAQPVSLDDSSSDCSPVVRKRHRVRFAFTAKRHDGVCLTNRVFDDLVWSHITAGPFVGTSMVIDVVRSHLEAEHLSTPAKPRARSSSTVSTDSDDTDDGSRPQSLRQVVASVSHLATDLAHRITASFSLLHDERGMASGAGVPVLPRGGGFAVKLGITHLRLVRQLSDILRIAAQELAQEPSRTLVGGKFWDARVSRCVATGRN